MSFAQEWAGLVADARARQSTSMRLNGAGDSPGGSGGPGGKGDGKMLHVTKDVLKSHAGKAKEVSEAFAKADNAAMRETEQVPGSMKGFASDEAFKDFQELWRDQMKYLGSLYSGVAKALTSVEKIFTMTDEERRRELEKVAPDKDVPAKPGDLLRPNSPYLLDRAQTDFPLTQNPGPSLLNPQGTDKPLYGPYAPTVPTAEPKS
ncbi:type VII secretion target [Streptomyces sp. NPDC053499]|uniref:type VII secretion target n=1 Tax=Streptomyces sp. NPDC053499 TaxID=3365707 RepID=UPI0037CE261D